MATDPLAQIYTNMKQQQANQNVKTSEVTPKEKEDEKLQEEEILDEGLTDEAIEKILASIKKSLQSARDKKTKAKDIIKKIDVTLQDWFGTEQPELGQ
jgi:hypothetical protein